MQVIERYIQARGGADALLNLQTESAEGDISVEPGNLTGKISLKVIIGDARNALPLVGPAPAVFGGMACVRVTTDIGGHRQVRASDGRTGWEWDSALGFGLISPAQLAAEYGLRTDLNLLGTYPGIRRLPDEMLDGRRCQVLALAPAGRPPDTWYFDAVTGLLVRRADPSTTGGAGPTLSYGDYRRVEGVLTPFRLIYGQAGGSKVVISFQSVAFNERLDGVAFYPPVDPLARNAQIDGILERYVAACGGARALLQVRARVTRSTTNRDGAGATTEVLYQKFPDKVLSVQQDPGVGQSQRGYDGHTGWELSDIQGFRTLHGIELIETANQADLQGPLHLARDFPLRHWVGEKNIGGRPAVGFTLSNGALSIGTYYFDPKTGQLIATQSTINNGAQGYMPVTMEFSDFRAVDGVVMPFRVELRNPAMHSVTTIQSVAQNQPLADSIFAPKRE